MSLLTLILFYLGVDYLCWHWHLRCLFQELTDKKYKSESLIRELKSKLAVLEEEASRTKQEVASLRKHNASLDAESHEREKVSFCFSHVCMSVDDVHVSVCVCVRTHACVCACVYRWVQCVCNCKWQLKSVTWSTLKDGTAESCHLLRNKIFFFCPCFCPNLHIST